MGIQPRWKLSPQHHVGLGQGKPGTLVSESLGTGWSLAMCPPWTVLQGKQQYEMNTLSFSTPGLSGISFIETISTNNLLSTNKSCSAKIGYYTITIAVTGILFIIFSCLVKKFAE